MVRRDIHKEPLIAALLKNETRMIPRRLLALQQINPTLLMRPGFRLQKLPPEVRELTGQLNPISLTNRATGRHRLRNLNQAGKLRVLLLIRGIPRIGPLPHVQGFLHSEALSDALNHHTFSCIVGLLSTNAVLS